MEQKIFILSGCLADKLTVETLALALQKLYYGKDTGLGLFVEEITGKKIKYMKNTNSDKKIEIIPKESKTIYLYE